VKWQRVGWTVVAAAICVAAWWPAISAGGSEYRQKPKAEHAPDFSISTIAGKSLKFEKLKGRPVIVDFWATWCGPCRYAMPHLQAMHERYGKDGLTVIGVSVDDGGPERVKKYVDRLGVSFPIAMANEEMLDAYGPLRALPTTFFINRQGDVVRRVVGYIDAETLESYVQEAMR
jgi:thiol-disulfide isomerase/thioredoxin